MKYIQAKRGILLIIKKANDGGILTNGMSRYSRLSPGGVFHEDALLIKTGPLLTTNIKNDKITPKYKLFGNLTNNKLIIDGPLDLIESWTVYSFQGGEVIHGRQWPESLAIRNLVSGIYMLKIIDRNNYQYLFKFVKI